MNLIGLRFLARHLVTFNFPARTLYIKQRNVGLLADADQDVATGFLNSLKAGNGLPGWSASDKGALYCDACGDFAYFDGRKKGETSTYHYLVGRASKDSPWKLMKAWRTDHKDGIIEKYRVP